MEELKNSTENDAIVDPLIATEAYWLQMCETWEKETYKRMREKALADKATEFDINELGYWMETYMKRAWNGEFFDIGDNLILVRHYEEKEPGLELVWYELKKRNN